MIYTVFIYILSGFLIISSIINIMIHKRYSNKIKEVMFGYSVLCGVQDKLMKDISAAKELYKQVLEKLESK